MKATTHWVAALFVAITCIPALSTAQSSAQKRTPPPKSAPAPAPQRRPPETGKPPAQAVPRPPASRRSTRPAPRPPARPPESRTLIYPYYFHDFDFLYQFPYGVYPYSRYPYPPYGYAAPVPGCVSAEGEVEGIEGTGAVRIEIPQKEAAVYIDGFYVGAVEDFNGATEQLTLSPGPHHLELRAAGYQTLTFDVQVQTGRTITYRTPMQPAS